MQNFGARVESHYSERDMCVASSHTSAIRPGGRQPKLVGSQKFEKEASSQITTNQMVKELLRKYGLRRGMLNKDGVLSWSKKLTFLDVGGGDLSGSLDREKHIIQRDFYDFGVDASEQDIMFTRVNEDMKAVPLHNASLLQQMAGPTQSNYAIAKALGLSVPKGQVGDTHEFSKFKAFMVIKAREADYSGRLANMARLVAVASFNNMTGGVVPNEAGKLSGIETRMVQREEAWTRTAELVGNACVAVGDATSMGFYSFLLCAVCGVDAIYSGYGGGRFGSKIMPSEQAREVMFVTTLETDGTLTGDPRLGGALPKSVMTEEAWRWMNHGPLALAYMRQYAHELGLSSHVDKILVNTWLSLAYSKQKTIRMGYSCNPVKLDACTSLITSRGLSQVCALDANELMLCVGGMVVSIECAVASCLIDRSASKTGASPDDMLSSILNVGASAGRAWSAGIARSALGKYAEMVNTAGFFVSMTKDDKANYMAEFINKISRLTMMEKPPGEFITKLLDDGVLADFGGANKRVSTKARWSIAGVFAALEGRALPKNADPHNYLKNSHKAAAYGLGGWKVRMVVSRTQRDTIGHLSNTVGRSVSVGGVGLMTRLRASNNHDLEIRHREKKKKKERDKEVKPAD